MTPREMYAFAAGPGEVETRQNVEDALKFLHGDMPLHSPERHSREKGHT